MEARPLWFLPFQTSDLIEIIGIADTENGC
jgi:hypothetical protein